jgi:hypothetical protein
VRPRRTAGLTLLEVALALSIMAVVSAGLISLQAQSAARAKDAATSDRTAAIVQAANTYIQQNFTQIVTDYAAPGLAIPIYTASGAAPAGLTSVQAAGLLPSGWTTTNPYGQAEWLLVLQTSATPTFDFLVVTQGGQNIPAGELPYVAAKVGAAGGFVSSQAPYTATSVEGAYGGWNYLASKWAIGGHAPSDGHLAAVLSFGQTPLAQYLYRVSVPGHPEANQMSTALDMNGNDIDNANSVNAVNVNATNLNASGKLAVTGTSTFGADISVTGNVTASGTLTAQDFVLSGQGNKKVSTGIYDAAMVASGTVVAKPTCPAGENPQIFLAPASFSDNGTGGTMSSVQTWAVNNGATWTVNMQVQTEAGTITPDAAHGAIQVLTKCS